MDELFINISTIHLIISLIKNKSLKDLLVLIESLIEYCEALDKEKYPYMVNTIAKLYLMKMSINPKFVKSGTKALEDFKKDKLALEEKIRQYHCTIPEIKYEMHFIEAVIHVKMFEDQFGDDIINLQRKRGRIVKGTKTMAKTLEDFRDFADIGE